MECLSKPAVVIAKSSGCRRAPVPVSITSHSKRLLWACSSSMIAPCTLRPSIVSASAPGGQGKRLAGPLAFGMAQVSKKGENAQCSFSVKMQSAVFGAFQICHMPLDSLADTSTDNDTAGDHIVDVLFGCVLCLSFGQR